MNSQRMELGRKNFQYKDILEYEVVTEMRILYHSKMLNFSLQSLILDIVYQVL